MKLSLFNKNKKVLLVGEGNFSFAVTLVKQKLNIFLTATCYETDVTDTGKKNIEILKQSGIQVLLQVDATKLEEHRLLNIEYFDIIVFNFPHVGGKMRIGKNRELLKSFFTSAKSILKSDGQILLSLCDGQGGTPADKSRRIWNNSWQVTEMAAHGGFILVATEPFNSSLFETYNVTGYRSLEKQFNTKGSITHIFRLVDEPNITNIAPKKRVYLEKYAEHVHWKNIFVDNNENVDDDDSNFSLYPNYYKFDITFYINAEFNIVKLYEILYNNAGLIIDNIEFLGSYIFSDLRESRSFRITYKSKKFPLYRKLVISIHENILAELIKKNLNVTMSK